MFIRISNVNKVFIKRLKINQIDRDKVIKASMNLILNIVGLSNEV